MNTSITIQSIPTASTAESIIGSGVLKLYPNIKAAVQKEVGQKKNMKDISAKSAAFLSPTTSWVKKDLSANCRKNDIYENLF